VEFERRDEDDGDNGDDDGDDEGDDEDEEEFEEEEFEGVIASVDIPNSSFTLTNGRTLYVNDSTEIDDGDYRNLQQVHGAVRSGIAVQAEGEFYTSTDGRNIVIEVEFERRDEDDGDNGDDDGNDEGDNGDDDDDDNDDDDDDDDSDDDDDDDDDDEEED
ncbi:MAG: hypothetical protein WD355_03280, partial [Balneolaceae bacterium]